MGGYIHLEVRIHPDVSDPWRITIVVSLLHALACWYSTADCRFFIGLYFQALLGYNGADAQFLSFWCKVTVLSASLPATCVIMRSSG